MKHYLVYHSSEKMGRSFRESDDQEADTGCAGEGDFSIVTSKRINELPGSAVWLISGEGQPRSYRLEYWFLVGDVDRLEGDDEFGLTASGTWGARFYGGVRLDRLEWFPGFRQRYNNFSLGMSSIPDEYVRHLYATARSAGGDTPTDEYQATPATSGTATAADQPDAAVGPAPRRAAVVERIVRDTAVTAEVKRLHGHRCQVCGLRLETPAGPYAEGAHVRPLGSPHDGPDVAENVLCLCPNHHVLFDAWTFGVADDMSLVGMAGRLVTVAGHRVGVEYVRYHRERVMGGRAAQA